MPTRRRFLVAAGQVTAAYLLSACSARLPDGALGEGDEGNAALLTARPEGTSGQPSEGPLTGPGTHPLGLEDVGEALVHVPPTMVRGAAAPLVLGLHGAGGDAEGGIALLRPLAEERGLLLLAPASRASTWDVIRDGYGPDVALIDRALAAVFAAFTVDPGRVFVAGFSDGATYALGLGLANGGLFRKIVAFSPGFVPPRTPREGKPAVFVSHGEADDVLPIDRTSRRIVPALRDDGYDVTYREFSGPHAVPPDIARAAVDWLG